MRTTFRFLVAFLVACAAPASAEVALLVGEPFGRFGSFNPTGHAAIYLSRVCAETPTLLRLCGPEEAGVVISRYHRVAGYDWIAMPAAAYFYAVERPGETPEFADGEAVAKLRDDYRRAHLRELVPDGPEGETPKGDWTQLVGAAYDRTIYGFALETKPEDDERLVRHLNAQHNRARFHLLYRNCADFARGVVNFYYPRALRRNWIGDAGITTPKHSAQALARYRRRRPDLLHSEFVIPQIPGLNRSRKLRGVSESLIRSKKYVVPLVVLQPWVAATAAAAYLVTGRFNPSRASHAVCEPTALEACIAAAESAVYATGNAASGPAPPTSGSEAAQ